MSEREWAATMIIAMLVVLKVAAAGPVPSAFAGSASCQKCHAAEFRLQSRSEHAASLGRSSGDQPGEWAFGAGAQAITFVRRLGTEHYLEEGRSWFRESNNFDVTPGHRTTEGLKYRIFDPGAGIMRCFACHSTGPLQLSADESIVPNELGVRCEACHNGSAAHVKDPVHIRPRNPGKLSAVELNQLCGDCHRMPMGAAATPDLRDPWNARHQPLMLAASRCFKESNGKLSCLRCHSPHGPLETKLTAYDAACAKCHTAPKHSQPLEGKPCVVCHMPAVPAQRHLSFSNHRIAVYSNNDPMSPVKPF